MDIMICEQLKNLVNCMKTSLNNSLREYDLTASQFVVLEYLINNEGKNIIQKNICEYLELKHTTVIGIVNRLCEKGFIEHKDNNKAYITITKKGRHVYEEVGDYKANFEKNILKGISENERKTLEIQVQKMYKNIKENM